MWPGLSASARVRQLLSRFRSLVARFERFCPYSAVSESFSALSGPLKSLPPVQTAPAALLVSRWTGRAAGERDALHSPAEADTDLTRRAFSVDLSAQRPGQRPAVPDRPFFCRGPRGRFLPPLFVRIVFGPARWFARGGGETLPWPPLFAAAKRCVETCCPLAGGQLRRLDAACPSVCVSTCLSVYLCVCLSVCLSIFLYLSIYQSIYQSIYLYISVYLQIDRNRAATSARRLLRLGLAGPSQTRERERERESGREGERDAVCVRLGPGLSAVACGL